MANGAASSAGLTSFMRRQMKSGSSPTTAAMANQGLAAAAAPSSIDITGDHPAANSAAVTSIPDPASRPLMEDPPAPKPSRFAQLKPTPAIESRIEIKQISPGGTGGGRFSALAEKVKTSSPKEARINIVAVKTLTPLVASISFYPGNAADPAMKSAALANMIVKIQKAADDIVLAMGPTISNTGWAHGQVMQMLASIAAKQWETRGRIDLDSAVTQILTVTRNPTAELQSALDAYADSDLYLEVDSPDVAQSRITMSVTNAAWDLYDWVTREGLCLKESPSMGFSYERPVDQIVELLLGRIIDEARAMQIQVNSTDLQVAHLQGSIRRLANLVGAEYVTQTNALLTWIQDPNIQASERARRHTAVVEQFESNVVPQVMEWARINFVGIEHKARKLMEERKNEQNTPSESRPAL